jgi:hypothetical protein
MDNYPEKKSTNIWGKLYLKPNEPNRQLQNASSY